jgi:hypothetical protein
MIYIAVGSSARKNGGAATQFTIDLEDQTAGEVSPP